MIPYTGMIENDDLTLPPRTVSLTMAPEEKEMTFSMEEVHGGQGVIIKLDGKEVCWFDPFYMGKDWCSGDSPALVSQDFKTGKLRISFEDQHGSCQMQVLVNPDIPGHLFVRSDEPMQNTPRLGYTTAFDILPHDYFEEEEVQ